MVQLSTEGYVVPAGIPPTTAAQVFRDYGILVIRDVLPKSVSEATAAYLAGELEASRELFERYEIDIHSADAGEQVQALLNSQGAAVPASDRHVLLGHFPLSVRLNKALWEVPLALSEMPFLYEILQGRRLFVHMPPTARFVLPGNVGAAVPAHQDVTYNKHLGRFCVVWIPLVKIDDRCGGMAVFPRSHTQGDLFSGSDVRPSEGWLAAIDTSTLSRAELQPLCPGDVVIMDDHLVHESMANNSDRVRLSVDFRFFSEGSGSSKHYLDLSERCVVAPSA